MKIKDIIFEKATYDSMNSDSYSWRTEHDDKDRFQHPSISRVMSKQGYKRLGDGADQTAYMGPDGTVLKIFKTNRSNTGGLSESQRMCVEWIKYCQQNSKNPFLPKFSGFETFEFPQGSKQMYLQIRMERLGKFPMQWQYELAEMAGAVSNGTTLEEYLDGRLPAEEYDSEETTATLTMHLGIEGLQGLWKTMEELHEICESRGWNWDLHSGNFMIRNDGHPVILDPYFLGW